MFKGWKLLRNQGLRRVFVRQCSSLTVFSEHVRYESSATSHSRLLAMAAATALACGFGATAVTACEPQGKEESADYPIDELVVGLRLFLAEEQIDPDESERRLKGKPWNSYHSSERFPHLIVLPRSTEEVSKVLRLCHELRVPIVPYGGGTSLEGQLLSTRGGVSLDFSQMKRVIALHEHDLDVTVEAGLGYVELNEILKPLGLWFPLDPGPGATVGGMCACRCSGSTAVRYGSMRENVLNLTAVLADGTVIRTGSRARKSSAGYDVTRLLVGSEGTLAVITEATLKIHGIPRFSHAVRVSFPDNAEREGVVGAARTARDSLNCGVSVGRSELLDDEMVKIVNAANPNHPLGRWAELPTLLFEVTGISEQAVEEQKKILVGIARKHGGVDIQSYANTEDSAMLWKLRKECLWSALSQYPNKELMITDVCVPLSQLPTLISETKTDIAASGLPCPIIAHAGDGNFHVLILFDASDEKEVKTAKSLASKMALRAIDMGGTCTGEHGVGVGKKEFLHKEMGESTIDVMSRIKLALDPQQMLNPGKIFDVKPSVPASSANTSCGCKKE